MKKNYTFHKRKVWIVFFLCLLMIRFRCGLPGSDE